MIQLTHDKIDPTQLTGQATHPAAGAVVLFLGTTRGVTSDQSSGERHTARLMYEAYNSMAERKLAELEAAARERWPIVECLLVHRLGEVPVGEASVAVVVSTAHRREAFEAAEWLIDTLKQEVPIWKQEHYTDGQAEWVGAVRPTTG
ncbi:molybdenum cofactor biosynthesis protein MoaE [Aeoliella mucimassa]|nr:molybdenum cofactor biosynthesis protein MoaE [Aeoliella mucimassa]